jgi:glycerophosphoryl diester phosphodiesterase
MPANPKIIAHRGFTERYPENTLEALEAAIDAGADGVELDVQFCADETPVVLHDPDLRRVGGEAVLIDELKAEDLRSYSVHEPERFGDRFKGIAIPTLRQAAERLGRKSALVFVEIKRDTLPPYQLPQRVKKVLEACEPLGEKLVIISFEEAVLREARSLRDVAVGWVMPGWGIDAMDRVEVLEPDYLFIDIERLPPPPNPLWEGRWQWAVYEINEPESARELARRGIAWVETAAVDKMRQALGSG